MDVRVLTTFALPLALLATISAQVGAAPKSFNPVIRIDDVDRFYALYDSTGGKPTTAQVQKDYLDKASPGLVAFEKLRNITSDNIASEIAKHPETFADARRCAAVLPAVKVRLAAALARLRTLYPKAVFPPITILIGRGHTGGTANASAGVMIGLETMCSVPNFTTDVEGSFVHVIAHEYAHVQQPSAQVEDPNVKVLDASLIEGGAELVAELTSGSIGNRNLISATKGREKRIETAFVADEDKKADGSRWLYNGLGTPEWPGDLGYWVGYRIVKTYYIHAKDKRAALRDIIEIKDPKAFLAKSGWHPGIKLKN